MSTAKQDYFTRNLSLLPKASCSFRFEKEFASLTRKFEKRSQFQVPKMVSKIQPFNTSGDVYRTVYWKIPPPGGSGRGGGNQPMSFGGQI